MKSSIRSSFFSLAMLCFVTLLGISMGSSVFAFQDASQGTAQRTTPGTAPASKQKIRLSTGDFPDDIDPQIHSTALVQFWSSHVFEGLMRWGKSGEVEPGMAEKVQKSADGLVYTFHLRQNARWHDGSPVGAEDFLEAFRVLSDPKSGSENSDLFNEAGLEGPPKVLGAADKKSTQAIEFRLKRPVSYFLEMMAMTPFVPRPQVLLGAKYNRYNGPFFVAQSDKGKYLKLAKNPHYWDEASVSLQEIEMPSASPEELTSVRLLQVNSLDLIWGVSAAAQQIARTLPGMHVQPFRSGAVWFLQMNSDPKKDTSSLELRKAMMTRTNAREIVHKIMEMSGAKPLARIVPDEYWKHARSATEAPTDRKPSSAPRLDNETEIDLLVPDSPSGQRLGQYLQEQWKFTPNLKIKSNPAMSSVRLSKTKKGEYDVAQASLVPWYPDPLSFLGAFVSSPQGAAPKGFDELLTKASREQNPSKRETLLKEAENVLLNEAWVVPLYESGNILVSKKGLKSIGGAKFGPNPDFRFAKWE